MNITIKELLEFYKGKLELKERRMEAEKYVEEKNNEGFTSFKRETEYYVLKAEIELLRRFVDDLKDLESQLIQ